MILTFLTKRVAMKMKVLTIDGPSGVGKGTVSRKISALLGWDYLDSGAIYRVLALLSNNRGIDPSEVQQLSVLARGLPLNFRQANGVAEIYAEDLRVTEMIRTEECGRLASMVSAYPEVREALLARQRDFATERGLVADGRDMGTIVFPEAGVKVYLTASPEVRAWRRFHQLQQADQNVNFPSLLREIEARDARDMNRAIAPLRPASDAVLIDTSELSIEAVCEKVLSLVREVFP
jgi:cytidylate kinase